MKLLFDSQRTGRELGALKVLFMLPEVGARLALEKPKELVLERPGRPDQTALFQDPLAHPVPSARPQPFEYLGSRFYEFLSLKIPET